MLSSDVYQLLSYINQSRVHYFNEVYIKGKQTPYLIYQAFGDQRHETIMCQHNIDKRIERRNQAKQFYLQYKEMKIQLTEGTELLLGRGEQCSIKIDSESASRIHATIKCQSGKLILTDRSTNGTFVKTMLGKRSSDNLDLFFHHNGWSTTSSGVISLGDLITSHDNNVIHFRCI